MDTVCDQDAGSYGRAARLAWRSEVFSVAFQHVAVKLADRKHRRSSRHGRSDEAALAFDIGLTAASGLFDSAFYLSENEDVARAKLDPLRHYLQHGGVEGRQPCPFFDGATYLASYEDLREAGVNPLLHYLKFGIPEDRTAGVPVRHPVPLTLADVLEQTGSAAMPGFLDVFASLPTLGCYEAAMDLKASVEAREDALAAELAAMQDREAAREAAHLAEAEQLQAAREDIELRLYVANASLQRADARNDALMCAQQECTREKDALRRERDDIEARLRTAATALARTGELEEALCTARQDNEALRAELERREDERRRLEVDLATSRDAVAGGRREVEMARSELAATAGELAIAARELMLTGRELQRLHSEVSDHRQACAERDALRLHVAVLEGDLQQRREQEVTLLASRAEMAAITNEIRVGFVNAAQGGIVQHQIFDTRDQLAGRLELLTNEVTTLRRGIEARPDTGSLAARNRYLDLLEATLTGVLVGDENMSPWGGTSFDSNRRLIGRDWPRTAVTMIGTARMRNLRRLLQTILDDNIEGDVLEAGVWRGGACIYMRGILAAHGITDRTVWVADSFKGLPPPDEELYPADKGDPHHTFQDLAIPLEEVQRNFARFDLLDEQVKFLPGWFKDTLQEAPITHLAVLRLDGDMYSSTIETLEGLYSKVSAGGFIIIDDYILEGCRAAVDDFRRKNQIFDALVDVDGAAVYWRKS